MRIKTGLKASIGVVALAGLTACGAPQHNPNTYSTGQAMQAQNVQFGRIIDMKTVETRHVQRGDAAAGVILGGIAGAMVGDQFGKGNGNTLMTGAGAIAGAALGQNVATAANRSMSQQWFVQLDRGGVISVIQNDSSLFVGAGVRVISDGYGTRIVH